MDAKLSIDNEIKTEIINSYILALLVFPIVSFLVYVLGSFIGIGGVALPKLVFTATVAGLLLTTISIITSLFISIISFRYKINPDNVTIPLIAGVVDIMGVFTLLSVMNG